MAEALLAETAFADPLARRLAMPRSAHVTLHWLGQAGFIVTTPDYRLIIDPYLSDSLARKYEHNATSHERMMPTPVSLHDLGPIDLVLCTHQHTDHMDAETLKPLARADPKLHFVVPRAALAFACERIGIGEERLIPLDAGDRVEPVPGLIIRALRAAHETLEKDPQGHHRFLGYAIETEGLRIFHSGDTIPFPGQVDDISAIAPHLALLPVNGRSDRLRTAGISGNLTIEEAVELCAACRIPALIAHHYGMFAFNTADPRAIDRAAASAPLRMLRARLQMEYVLGPV
jgi:L-ascorbate metabolism protein UlaG (beta-lactamase superfamily)